MTRPRHLCVWADNSELSSFVVSFGDAANIRSSALGGEGGGAGGGEGCEGVGVAAAAGSTLGIDCSARSHDSSVCGVVGVTEEYTGRGALGLADEYDGDFDERGSVRVPTIANVIKRPIVANAYLIFTLRIVLSS